MKRNERGVVLILAVGCLTILVAVMAALSGGGSATQQLMTRRESELRAGMAARSGLSYALARLRQRGNFYFRTRSGEPTVPPTSVAGDDWIASGAVSPRKALQTAYGPHTETECFFTVQVRRLDQPPVRPFDRPNLSDPGAIDPAHAYQLTVIGSHAAAGGNVLAQKTMTLRFHGCNVVPIGMTEVP